MDFSDASVRQRRRGFWVCLSPCGGHVSLNAAQPDSCLNLRHYWPVAACGDLEGIGGRLARAPLASRPAISIDGKSPDELDETPHVGQRRAVTVSRPAPASTRRPGRRAAILGRVGREEARGLAEADEPGLTTMRGSGSSPTCRSCGSRALLNLSAPGRTRQRRKRV